MDNIQIRLHNLIARLKEANYRLTPQRMAIIKALVSGEGHPTMEQVYEQVRKDFPMTSLATVYKTVTLLKEMGEIREIGLSGDARHYDGASPYPHPHLICVRCKSIVDLRGDILDKLSPEVASDTGYQIVDYQLQFFGICPKCQKNQA